MISAKFSGATGDFGAGGTDCNQVQLIGDRRMRGSQTREQVEDVMNGLMVALVVAALLIGEY